MFIFFSKNDLNMLATCCLLWCFYNNGNFFKKQSLTQTLHSSSLGSKLGKSHFCNFTPMILTKYLIMFDCFISTATQGSNTLKEIKEDKKREYPGHWWKQDAIDQLSMNMTAWKTCGISGRCLQSLLRGPIMKKMLMNTDISFPQITNTTTPVAITSFHN